MITRSKTGSLTPKLFSDSVMGTSLKSTNIKSLNTSSSDEVLIINKDGEITRVARSKLTSTTSIFTQQQYFKLGKKSSMFNVTFVMLQIFLHSVNASKNKLCPFKTNQVGL